LPATAYRTVERAFGVVAAADQCAHGSVGIDCHQRAFTDAVALAIDQQHIGDGLCGRRLHSEIDRCVDDDVFIDGANEAGQEIHDPVGDVAAAAAGNIVNGLD